MTLTQPQPRRSLGAAIGLFFLAPFIAEYLLGDFPITQPGLLLVMAPMYGGGALLIREAVRRTGRGWPSIALLALAYGIFEEAFTTQSLFNPNYLGRNFHLLDHAFIPALGIGAWWTLFVLTLHTAWSISTSIALVEGLVPSRRTTPWLGKVGLAIVAALFVAGAALMTSFSYHHDHFLASNAQFVSAAIAIVIFVIAAFRLFRAAPPTEVGITGQAVNPWLAGLVALLLASGVLVVPPTWNWGAAAIVFALDAAAVILIALWSRNAVWTPLHRLAVGGGAALAYAWHAFLTAPLTGGSTAEARVSHAICALLAIAIIAIAARRSARPAIISTFNG